MIGILDKPTLMFEEIRDREFPYKVSAVPSELVREIRSQLGEPMVMFNPINCSEEYVRYHVARYEWHVYFRIIKLRSAYDLYFRNEGDAVLAKLLS